MSDNIEVSYTKLDNVMLVDFNFGNKKFCIASPPHEEGTESGLFQVLANRVPSQAVSNTIELHKDIARDIWSDLMNMGYQRMHDVESVLNQRRVDDSFRAYKIRDKKTGLYSKGGAEGGKFLWSKKGKTWNQVNHLKAHLTQMEKLNPALPDYVNAEVVELGERRSVDLNDFGDLIK
jgi:hypothetical protein